MTAKVLIHGGERPIISANDRFGHLVVLGADYTRPGYLVCRCVCGREKSVRRASLICRDTRSCGACRLDLTGRTFGYLVVIQRADNVHSTTKHPAGKPAFSCRCDCGVVKVIPADHLRRGRIVSCGCRKRQLDLGPRNTKHGMNTGAIREEYGTRPGRLYRAHGLLWDRFLALLTAQDQRCSICTRIITHQTATIDHDHSCCPGKRSCGECIRGALCVQCNAGLGMFSDDPVKLLAAHRYLTAASRAVAYASPSSQ